jgi:ferric-dicitrate binding protein FerR (iron transport regulator)
VRGEALAEVDQVDKNTFLHFVAKGANVLLDHSGLYLFGDGDLAVAVYHGKLRVEDDRRRIDLHRGQALCLDSATLKPKKFDPATPNTLYSWSERRAGYASQVSEWTGESLLGLDDQSSYSDG